MQKDILVELLNQRDDELRNQRAEKARLVQGRGADIARFLRALTGPSQ